MNDLLTEAPPEHIGWDMWRATSAWKNRYTQEMIDLGYSWYGEARGNLMQHIPVNGIAQAALVKKSGLSKQAIQQLLDDLESDGVINRITDEKDSRRKSVLLSTRGVQAFKAANKIKKELEAEYRELLGSASFTDLKLALEKIIEHGSNA